MTETLNIPITQVDEGPRARKEYGDLSGLKNSLQSIGSIHPVVLSKNPSGTYMLVAGGRRFRSAVELGTKELTHGSILEPGKIGFLFRDEVPEDILREAELDENLYRLKPKWHEDVQLVADVHELKRKKFGSNKWGQRQTADLLGPNYGLTTVNYSLRLAKLIKAGDKDILSASNMTDAIAILLKRKEDEALRELNKRVAEKVGSGPTIGPAGPIQTSSFLDSFSKGPAVVRLGPDGRPNPFPTLAEYQAGKTPMAEAAALAALDESTGPLEPTAPAEVPLSRMFFNADFREGMKDWPEASIDHIVTDIPYGINMDNMRANMVADVRDEHDVEANLLLMPEFLQLAYHVVKPGGFCVFFYDLDHHEKLQSWATDMGWRAQRWPLIAYKTSACQNNAAQFNFTKNYEVAMVLRRTEHSVLRKQQPTSVWMGDFAAERKLYNNPFAKPFGLWKWIFDAIAFTGQSILDPFCGEMSGSKAAINCGLIPYGFEIKEEHYNRGLEHIRATYALIHKSNVNFT